jgi:4-coumarate--CoA ligase
MSKPTYNKETKVWSGPKVPPIYNPDQNLGQLIVKVLEQTPAEVTQISADTGVSVTCGEMRDRILKVAAHLSGLGLKQGDVIGVVAANTENLAPLVFACFLLGLPVNPLAPIMVEADIVQMYSKTKPKVIFCDENKLKSVHAAVDILKSGAKIYTIMEKVDDYGCVTEIIKMSHLPDDLKIPSFDSNTTALIICSSGSTGSPKGTCRTHKEIITHFVPSSPYDPTSRCVLYQFSAIFWFSGIYSLVMCTLYNCLRIITAQPSTPELMIDIINKYKVTNVFTAPYAILNLLQQETLKPFESVKIWIIGGANVTEALSEKLQYFVPNGIISASYGSSEYGFISNNCGGMKFGSCGEIFENIQLKVRNL